MGVFFTPNSYNIDCFGEKWNICKGHTQGHVEILNFKEDKTHAAEDFDGDLESGVCDSFFMLWLSFSVKRYDGNRAEKVEGGENTISL